MAYDYEIRGTGVAGKDVPAHPFIRPAFESAQGEAEAAMIADFEHFVTEIGE